jgi:hypothetical protein
MKPTLFTSETFGEPSQKTGKLALTFSFVKGKGAHSQSLQDPIKNIIARPT